MKIIKRFIEECLKYEPVEWAKLRQFDLSVLKSIGVGFCDNEVYSVLMQEDKEAMMKSELVTGKQYKYVGMPIIKVTSEYFVAKPRHAKNLFPKGKKQSWFIKGTDDTCFITEGETDAIRLKHEYPNSSMLSLGGVGSLKPLNNLGEYFIGKNVVIAFDNDEAGVEGTQTAVKELSNQDYIVKKMIFSDKVKDIDEYFKNGLLKDDIKFDDIKFEKNNNAKAQTKKTKLAEIEDYKMGVSEGMRNEACFFLAKHYRKRGLERNETFMLLKKWNEKNKPPMTEQEIESVINSTFEYQERKDEERLKVDNYLDNAKAFYKKQPFFYDKQETFWFWKQDHWEIVDDVEVSRMLDNELGFAGQTINSAVRNGNLTALQWVGRELHPTEAPIRWIQFKNKAFSLRSNNLYDVKPNYFFTNPIPFEIGQSEETPTLDKLFTEWVGADNVNMLYEIIAYSCYRSYPIQVLFCLYGNGRNGKSCFQKILTKFLGVTNICSTELDMIIGNNMSRFETSKMYKKLMCTMGETNFGTLNKSSMLKKLTGGDVIGFERKGKPPFDDYSYAKIVIASNSLPTTDDTSEGFYRRWVIIDFPNQFAEGKDVTETIPNIEYCNLAKKVIKILPFLLKKGEFTGQGDIDSRKKKYVMASNPLPMFIDCGCEKDNTAYVRYSELYTAYVGFLSKHKRRIISRKEFTSILTSEGYEIRRTSKKEGEEWQNDNWIEGLRLFSVRCVRCNQFPNQEKCYIERSGKTCTSNTSYTKPENDAPITNSELVISNKSILDRLSAIVPTTTETLALQLKTSVGQIYPILIELRLKGDIMESPKDHWLLLS